ncbi:DMT family transporter [Tistrella mobilis]|nr:DMT family transporter [Tistrella mobilis]
MPLRDTTMTGSIRQTPASAVPSGSAVIIGLAWGLLGVLVWSGSFILTRFGVRTSLGPFDIIALRFMVAGLLLAPVILRRGLAWRRLGPLGLGLLVLGGGAPYALLSAAGLQYAPAGQAAALIPGLMTAAVALIGIRALGEPLTRPRMAGVAAVLAGSITIAAVSAGPGQTPGHAIFLCAALVWTGYVMVLRRSAIDGLHATAIAAVVSAVCYLPVYALFLPSAFGTAPVADMAIQAIYQGVGATVFGLYAFNQAVRRLGAAGGAALSALIPVVTMALAAPLLGEVPGPIDLAAALVITVGVLLLTVLRGRRGLR